MGREGQIPAVRSVMRRCGGGAGGSAAAHVRASVAHARSILSRDKTAAGWPRAAAAAAIARVDAMVAAVSAPNPPPYAWQNVACALSDISSAVCTLLLHRCVEIDGVGCVIQLQRRCMQMALLLAAAPRRHEGPPVGSPSLGSDVEVLANDGRVPCFDVEWSAAADAWMRILVS